MAEGTVRKSTVEFRVIATGTFMVEHEDGESPAEKFKSLIDTKSAYGNPLSFVDLYLHSEEFDWSIEATDEPHVNHEKQHTFDRFGDCERCGRSWEAVVTSNLPCPAVDTDRSVQGKQGTDLGADDQEWFDRTVRDEAPADEGELYRRQADEQDAELRERDRLEREEIGDALREQWEQR